MKFFPIIKGLFKLQSRKLPGLNQTKISFNQKTL